MLCLSQYDKIKRKHSKIKFTKLFIFNIFYKFFIFRYSYSLSYVLNIFIQICDISLHSSEYLSLLNDHLAVLFVSERYFLRVIR